tara:strand:- start:15559 stop:16782 length:1224 start_codon:yes stop_codon:yes gene_type:complete
MTYIPSDLANRIIVTQDNIATTLGGTIDSTKEYFLDGIIDLGTTQITVPTTGLTLKGFSFDVSGLTSSEDNYTMFISETILIGSGNVLGSDYLIDVSGTNSKVYEIYDATGFNAFEFQRVNYNNCTSLGDIYDYRQGLESGTGRFGGSPSLTLHGLWLGGYRITTSIVRSMSDLTTEPLFKAGTLFQMNSRFLTDMNVDLGDLQPLLDFIPADFPNPSTLQLKGCLITRGGVTDSSDSNITPNVLSSHLCSNWDNNVGIPNTFIGGAAEITTEVLTTISAINTKTLLLGTWTQSDLQHFDANNNWSLRNLGTEPIDYRVTFDFVLEGTQAKEYRIYLQKDSGGVVTTEFTQLRTIDRLSGGRDVSYFTGTFGIVLNQNDFIYWEVENISGSQNCTIELDSQFIIEER